MRARSSGDCVTPPNVLPLTLASSPSGELRQSEIQNLGVAALGDENVCRIDIAMNDAMRVRGVQRVGNLDSEPEQKVNFQRTPRNAVHQGHAVQKFHGDEGFAVQLTNVVNRTNIRMIQRRCGFGFELKTGERLRIMSNLLGQELERDEAMQPHVLGLINHPHAAAAEFLDDAVVRDGLSNQSFVDHSKCPSVRSSHLTDAAPARQ